MDNFTLAVVIGIVGVVVSFVCLFLMDKGAPEPAKTRDKRA